MRFWNELIKGLWKENPIFRLVLGMCPTLAVTTTLENGLGMGMAATFVLVCSNVVIAMVRKIIPSKVRIPCFIVIIAAFVTVVDMLMNGFANELHGKLGIFIPLIVVNCIILGRAEAFASKNSVWLSLADGIGMGLGFTLGLGVLAAMRELIGTGTLTFWTTADGPLGLAIPGYVDHSLILFILPCGGFIALGLLLGLMNHLQAVIAAAKGESYPPPVTLDCRHCTLCKWGE
jgi:electron transport complex protein RnfE